MHPAITIEHLQALADRCPFNAWIGFRFEAIDEGSVTIRIPWRPEMIGIPDPPTLHGGVLATAVDFAAANAIATLLGQATPTIDLRIDYHAVARQGDLRVKGRVIRLGKTLGTAEAEVHDAAGRLVASGRGSFFAAKITEQAKAKGILG